MVEVCSLHVYLGEIIYVFFIMREGHLKFIFIMLGLGNLDTN